MNTLDEILLHNYTPGRYSEDKRKVCKLWYLIASLLIGVVIGYFLFSKKPDTITTTTHHFVYQDTGSYHVEYVPKPVYIHHTDTAWKTIEIDTAEILADYFAVRGYKDTIVDDSSLTIAYTAVVNRNELKGITFDYKNNRPIQMITNTTVVDNGKKYWIGVNVGGNKERFDISPMVAYQHKRIQYIGEYGIFNKEIRIGVLYGF